MYRGKHRRPDDCENGDVALDLGKLYADEVGQVCEDIKKKDRGVAAYIAESLQSCGGQIVYPDGYLRNVFRLGPKH